MPSLILGQWSLTHSTNGFAVPDGAPEGWFGGDINWWGREIMTVIRTWYDDPEWLSVTEDLATRNPKPVVQLNASAFQVQDCDATDYFTTGRRVRLRNGITAVEATVKSSSFGGTHTDVEIVGTNVPATMDTDGADVYFAKSIDPSAFASQPAVGDMKMTAGLQSAAAAEGWLECNGQEVLIADYPVLAEVLGSPLGTQIGHYDYHPSLGLPTIGSVRVPDMAGRVPVGFWDDATHPAGVASEPDDDYDYTNGLDIEEKRDKAWGGEKTHEILEAEMPLHDHEHVTSGTHVHPADGDNPTIQGSVKRP